MPKAFYTERDIEDMVKRGILSLEINDNVVLTNAAYEKAITLGMQLLRDKPDTPPTSPIRPYITDKKSQPAPRAGAGTQPKAEHQPAPPQQAPRDGLQTNPQAQPDGSEIRQRIRNAVFKQLGNKVDPDLLDVIITRVLENTGIK